MQHALWCIKIMHVHETLSHKIDGLSCAVSQSFKYEIECSNGGYLVLCYSPFVTLEQCTRPLVDKFGIAL